jgi:hypothetical protein
MDLLDAALVPLATARLARLVTTDDWGQWVLVDPIERACGCSRDEPDPKGFVAKAVTGLGCPFCVGYWIGVGVLASGIAARHTGPSTHRAWRFVMAGLALNYVVGHVSSRID